MKGVGSYLAGRKLEDLVRDILERMGFRVDQRVLCRNEFGEIVGEFDLLASRGSRVIAVECKNYSGKLVGLADLRSFRSKMEDVGILEGLFVSSTGFTSRARKYAEKNGIMLWDKAKLMEKIYDYALEHGGVFRYSLKLESALPLNVSYGEAVSNHLINGDLLEPSKVELVFIPYHVCGFSALIDEKHYECMCVANASTAEIPAITCGNVKKSFSRLDKFAEEVFEGWEEAKPYIARAFDYDVRRENVNLGIRDLKSMIVDRLTVWFRPKKVRIMLNTVTTVYLPLWRIAYRFLRRRFFKEVSGFSGEESVNELRYCEFPHKGKVESYAICETCGRLACRGHIHFLGGVHVCEKCLKS